MQKVVTSIVYDQMDSVYRKRFATIQDAESHYGLTLSDSLADLVIDRREAKAGRPKHKPSLTEFETRNEASP